MMRCKICNKIIWGDYIFEQSSSNEITYWHKSCDKPLWSREELKELAKQLD